MNNITKQCSRCGIVQSIDEFRASKTNRDGHRNQCRECDRKASRERRGRYMKEGRCTNCGQGLIADGQTWLCIKCADKNNNRVEARMKRLLENGLCFECGRRPLVSKNYCEQCHMAHLIFNIRTRAKQNNVPFDGDYMTVDNMLELKASEGNKCPVFGVPFMYGKDIQCDASPSIDKVIPSLGYVRGNVAIISDKANRIKRNASLEELKQIVDWFEKMQNAKRIESEILGN